MKKITLLMTLLVAMVTTAMAQITSLEDVNQNKCYVVTTVQGNRGGWSVTEDGSKFSSTFDVSGTKNYDITDKKQQFAFVKNTDGNYYLWSIGASKFVLSNMALSANTGEAIQFNDASGYNKWDGTQVQVQFVGNSDGYINLGGSNQMTVDDWGSVDDGNAVTLIEADDFDPSVALDILAKEVTITYNHIFDGKTVFTEEVIATKGKAFPAATLPGGVSATYPEGTVTAAGTYDIVCTLDGTLPFATMTAAEFNTTKNWYRMTLRGKQISYDSSNGKFVYSGNLTDQVSPSVLFAFEGNPYSGYKIYNMKAGSDKIMWSANTGNGTQIGAEEIANVTDAGVFTYIKNGSLNLFKKPGTANCYMHDFGGKVSYWNENGAANDAGSGVTFTKEEYSVEDFELPEAINDLSSLIKKAESFYEYDYTACDWQTENPDAPYYITCPQEHNALNPQATDGQGVGALVDGKSDTFMHSAWMNTPNGPHYILVDFGSGRYVEDFRIDYTSRSGADDDFPTEIKVYGSNDGVDFEQVAVTTGYPKSAGQSYSLVVNGKKSYRYFRFDVTNTYGEHYGYRTYFHAAEFVVSIASLKESTRNTNITTVITEGENALNSNSLSEINAAAEKITNYVAVLTATDALLANIAECQTLFSNLPLGDGLGEYSSSNANYMAEFSAIVDFANNVSTETTAADIEAKNNELNAIKASFSINQPADGSYLRIRAAKEWIAEQPYLSSVNSTVNTARAAFVNTADETTIFYYKDKNLYAVNTAAYLGNSGNFAGYTTNNAATDFVFTAAVTGQIGAYNVLFNEGARFMFTNKNLHTDAGGGVTAASTNVNGYSFILEAVSAEEVAELPTHTLTVSAAKYSTLYLGYAVALPEGVKAYAVESINNETGYATLAAVEGVLPANTGFILQAEQGSYTFERPAAGVGRATIASNMLKGTVEATYIEVGTATPYVLGLDANSVVGLYQAKVTDSKFLNNANKAYLLLDAAQSSNTYGYRFDGENTTGIETIETLAQDNVIYDLTGRRVEKAVKGLYIVNGKKVLVK